MNIQSAKEEITRTLRSYTERTEDGVLCIPPARQRPILLIGPPGIGKTAIMEQIASEESVGLVNCTMTHHTRQSAIGLPVLKEHSCQGKTYTVTEYTMSEIVAGIYDCMERTGAACGILFIDEFNCVSETLSPVMLQLLQSKTFGTHRIPEGWLIVAAGNPPEYNRSVREFDMVTLDRVRLITVEADLDAWKRYVCDAGIHPSVLAYLNLYPDSFYVVENAHGLLSFVTARGWEDMSGILLSYERNDEPVTEELVLQYLQHEATARNFFLFYELFCHYAESFASEDYFSPSVYQQIEKADPSESIATASMLFARIAADARELAFCEQILQRFEDLTGQYENMANRGSLNGRSDVERMSDFLKRRREANRIREDNGLLTIDEKILDNRVFRLMEDSLLHARTARGNGSASLSGALLQMRDQKKEELVRSSEKIVLFIQNSYELLEASPVSICLSYFTADLTASADCIRLLRRSPCDAWLRHSDELLLDRREAALKPVIS